MEFNPNGVGQPNGNYFALPYSPEEANVVLLSVPWDVTTSYAPGTADGPQAILNASPQLDLYDPFVKEPGRLASEPYLLMRTGATNRPNYESLLKMSSNA